MIRGFGPCRCQHLRDFQDLQGLPNLQDRQDLQNLEDLQDLQLAHPELTLYQIRAAWEKLIKQWFVLEGYEEPNVRRVANQEADRLRCELGVE